MGLFNYIKTAFFQRWNLLALFGGLGFAALSGRPDIFMPLVAAGEVAYLGLLGTHPKFQAYVNAQAAVVERQKNSLNANVVLRQILQQLPGQAISRYDRLRNRCAELRQIAQDLKKTNSLETGTPLESFQLAGLDRLMWIYLRLLFTQFSLGKFLDRTSDDQIQKDIRQAEARLDQLARGEQTEHTIRMTKTLQDNLQTCKDRLANYEKARANSELVALEIERLENKISSLAELAINRQEPDFISSQVDQVAQSMVETERTMNDLQFATGLAPLDEEVPEAIQETPVQVIR